MGGAVSRGYGAHGPAQPAAIDSANSATADAEATTSTQSFELMRTGLMCVRGPEPKPRASIDSASWIELSTLVRTTGTATSAHERGPRGRQPRMRCASL